LPQPCAWGRHIWEVAAKVSERAVDAGIDLAVTGRTGAAFLGVLGTSSPSEVRCWVDIGDRPLPSAAELLGLEPAFEEDANVAISVDPWRVGVHRSSTARFEEWAASVAHPLRVWCDLHGEQRGAEFAAQLWGEISRAG